MPQGSNSVVKTKTLLVGGRVRVTQVENFFKKKRLIYYAFVRNNTLSLSSLGYRDIKNLNQPQ